MNIHEKTQSVYQKVETKADENKKFWSERKKTSLRYADNQTPYFQKLYNSESSAAPKRKELIQKIIKASDKQSTCSLDPEFLHAGFSDKIVKKLIKIQRCTQRKTCSICASVDGKNNASRLKEFFKDRTEELRKIRHKKYFKEYLNKEDARAPKESTDEQKKEFYKNETLKNKRHMDAIKNSLLCYVITISPKNYDGENIGAMVLNGHRETDKILQRFRDGLKDDANRGTPEAQLARQQLKDGLDASYWTKEFELGKDGKINVHWHGLLFMRNAGSHLKTLDYKSLQEYVKWTNKGQPVQTMFGDSKRGQRPLNAEDDADKAFLEVTKYITKMSVKSEELGDFEERQELVWEVYAQTFGKQFIRQYGALIGYKIALSIDTDTPETLHHQKLTHLLSKNDYKSKLTDISHREELRPMYAEHKKREERELELEGARIKLASLISGKAKPSALKYPEINITRLESTIKGLTQRISDGLKLLACDFVTDEQEYRAEIRAHGRIIHKVLNKVVRASAPLVLDTTADPKKCTQNTEERFRDVLHAFTECEPAKLKDLPPPKPWGYYENERRENKGILK